MHESLLPIRRKAREVKLGPHVIGGENPIRVQSMTSTDTADAEATIAMEVTQTYELDGEPEEYSATYEYVLEKDGDTWLVLEVDVDADPVEDPDSDDRSADED